MLLSIDAAVGSAIRLMLAAGVPDFVLDRVRRVGEHALPVGAFTLQLKPVPDSTAGAPARPDRAKGM
jgi:hypothetical protein